MAAKVFHPPRSWKYPDFLSLKGELELDGITIDVIDDTSMSSGSALKITSEIVIVTIPIPTNEREYQHLLNTSLWRGFEKRRPIIPTTHALIMQYLARTWEFPIYRSPGAGPIAALLSAEDSD